MGWKRIGTAISVAVGSVGLFGVTAPLAAALDEPPVVTSQVVTSFDGTPIVTTLFVPARASAADPAPLVLQTHGWAGTGQTSAGGFVGQLLDAGYMVLTWDQRGFGCSGGEVTVDNPQLEGRDVSALIDWVAANAPVELDAEGDPLVGMTGGSYAGGIQTAAAAFDARIDVIAPEISWTDLRYSLYSGRVANQGWAALLYAAGLPTATGLGLSPDCATFPQAGGLDPRITQGLLEGATTGSISEPVLDFFAASSLAGYGDANPVAIPTLVIQGSVDTLFDLTDGYGIYERVQATGAPARFLVFCGGHVACPASYEDADDGGHVDAAVLAWFARHLRGDDGVDTGAAVEYRTNEGQWRGATTFPPSGFDAISASGRGSLVSVPVLEVPDVAALAAQIVSAGEGISGIPATPLTSAQVSAAGDPRSMVVELGVAGDEPLDVVGIPTVELTVSGIGAEVVLMAKLVDREAGEVLNLQEGAIRVPLTDGEVTVEVPMPGLAYTLAPGHHLDLQVSTASLMHGNARLPATADVLATATVPVEQTLAPPSPTEAVSPPGQTVADTARPSATRLPATGAGNPTLVPLLSLVAALAVRRLHS